MLGCKPESALVLVCAMSYRSTVALVLVCAMSYRSTVALVLVCAMSYRSTVALVATKLTFLLAQHSIREKAVGLVKNKASS